MIKRFITFTVFLMLMLWLMSCGQRFHLKKYQKLKDKADKHLAIAIAKGAKVNTDTLYKSLRIPLPGINVSFPFKPITAGVDTVYYDRDGVDVKIVYKRDNTGKAIAAKPIVRTDTVYKTVRVPYEVKTEVKNVPNKGSWWKWFLIGFVTCGAVVVFGRMIFSKVL